jgi:hypothetical protein
MEQAFYLLYHTIFAFAITTVTSKNKKEKSKSVKTWIS